MSIKSVTPSNHLILCHHLLLLPSIFSSIRFFSMSEFFTSGGQSIGASALYVCSVQRQKGMPLDRTNISTVNSNKLKYKVWVLSYFIRVRLFATRLLCPWGFSKQEYWRRLPCPSPGGLPDPGMEPGSPALQADSLPSELLGVHNLLNNQMYLINHHNITMR